MTGGQSNSVSIWLLKIEKTIHAYKITAYLWNLRVLAYLFSFNLCLILQVSNWFCSRHLVVSFGWVETGTYLGRRCIGRDTLRHHHRLGLAVAAAETETDLLILEAGDTFYSYVLHIYWSFQLLFNRFNLIYWWRGTKYFLRNN